MRTMPASNLLERMGLAGEGIAAEVDIYEPDSYLAFGFSRRGWGGGEPMIDFITKDGNHQALAYAHLYRLSYNPSTGIEMEFSDHLVAIHGQRLDAAYQKLTLHKVVFVTEADHATTRLVREEPLVSKLQINTLSDASGQGA